MILVILLAILVKLVRLVTKLVKLLLVVARPDLFETMLTRRNPKWSTHVPHAA